VRPAAGPRCERLARRPVLPLKDNIPTDRFALVTVVLIAINVVVFLFFQQPTGLAGVSDRTVVEYGAIPYEITHPGHPCGLGRGLNNGRLVPPAAGQPGDVVCEGQRVDTDAGPQRVRSVPDAAPTWLTLFTSMFMHGGFLHIIGNMLFLWIFGNNVEDSMGRGRFVAFYLLGGLAALAGQVLASPNSTAPTIGASGAVAAVLGGYLLLYPRARVLTLVFIIFFVTVIEVPAVLMLGFWFLQQVYFGAAELSDPLGGGAGVAYWAHIGGFVFGLVLIRAFAKRIKRIEPRYPVY
jgi:membrane associated rhomboid family serine protease